MLPFLRNVNDAVSSNDKDCVETVAATVPKLSNAFTHYASHHIHANFQFAVIDATMKSMKT